MMASPPDHALCAISATRATTCALAKAASRPKAAKWL
jgi:hypothetical protein